MKIGIIGGSGLYDIEGFERLDVYSIETPFGPPSDGIQHCRYGEEDIYFLPRHGTNHTILPSEINHRANIYAFKTLGVGQVLSISAVGSLHEDYRPGDIVLPDQYFDRTKTSARHTFFGNGIVAHLAFAEPTCKALRDLATKAANKVIAEQDKDVHVKNGGVYVNMEGPHFSTRAESRFYRFFGFDIIGMTSLAEAKLCREAEICYACLATVTDYDCWHEEEEAVSVEAVLKTLRANVSLAKDVVKEIMAGLADMDECTVCRTALENAIMTPPDAIPAQLKEDLKPIIGRYV